MDMDIINGLINFLVVALIFLAGLFTAFMIFCKKFKFDKKNIELYGMFLHLKPSSLVAVSALTINYLFLVWATVSFTGLNIIYVAFTLILVFISDISMDKFNALPKDIGITITNCLAIQVVYLIYDYLTTEYSSIMLFIILVLVVIFIFLYYTYNLFKSINNVVIDHKYLKKKKYKV